MSAERLDGLRTLELPVRGMDCAECTQHVQHALASLQGVEEAQVFLSSEKAVLRYDPTQVDLPAFHQAVKEAGYSIASEEAQHLDTPSAPSLSSLTRPILTLFALVF